MAVSNVDADWDEKWLYSAAILLGVYLRVAGFWEPSLWLDELSTAWASGAQGWGDLWRRSVLAHQTPLYYMVVRGFLTFGRNEFFLRLPTVIFGLASLAVLMITMRRVGGTRAALYAGAIYALNTRAILHGQEARMYAMVLLATMVSIYFFIASLHQGRSWRLAAYGASTLVVCYSHLIYTSLLLVQILVAFWLQSLRGERPATLRKLIGVQGTLLLLSAPLAPLFVSVGSARAALGSFIPRPNLHDLIWILTWPEMGLAVVLFVLSIPWVWVQRRKLSGLNVAEKALVGQGVGCLAILPAAAILAQLGVVNILDPRYLLLPLMAAIVLSVFVVVRLEDRLLRLGMWTFVLLVGILQATISIRVGSWSAIRKEDWRGAIGWVQQHYRPGDVILLRAGLIEAKYLSPETPGAQEYLALPLCGFYDRGGMTVFNLPWRAGELYSSPLTPVAVQQQAQLAPRVFLLVAAPLDWDWGLLEKWLQQPGRPPRQVEKHSFEELGVRVYQPPEDTSMPPSITGPAGRNDR